MTFYLFDKAIQVALARSDGPKGQNTVYTARLSTGFDGEPGRPIGSYVLCVALKAMLAHSAQLGFPDIISLHTDFYTSAPGGSNVEIRLTERRRGRNYLFMDAVLVLADETVVIGCHGVFGTLPDDGSAQALVKRHQKWDSLPPVEACVDPFPRYFPARPRREPDTGDVSVGESTAVRADPVALQNAIDAGLRSAEIDKVVAPLDIHEGQQWVLHPDGRPADQLTAAFFADAPPLNLILRSRGAVKLGGFARIPTTVSLSIHFFSRPCGKLMRREIEVGVVNDEARDGVSDWEVRLWDEKAERIVCVGRQVAHSMIVKPRNAKI